MLDFVKNKNLEEIYPISDNLYFRTSLIDDIVNNLINKLSFTMPKRTIEILKLLPKNYHISISPDGYHTMNFRLILPLDQHTLVNDTILTEIESKLLQRTLSSFENFNSYRYMPSILVNKIQNEIRRIVGRDDLFLDASPIDRDWFNENYNIDINKNLYEINCKGEKIDYEYKCFYMRFYDYDKNTYNIDTLDCYYKFAEENKFNGNEIELMNDNINVTDTTYINVDDEYEYEENNNKIVLLTYFKNSMVYPGDIVRVHGIDASFMNDVIEFEIDSNVERDNGIEFSDEYNDKYETLIEALNNYDTFVPVCVEIVCEEDDF